MKTSAWRRWFADIATIGVLHEREVARADDRSEQLRGALDSRILIEQAKGIIAERHDVPMDEAVRRDPPPRPDDCDAERCGPRPSRQEDASAWVPGGIEPPLRKVLAHRQLERPMEVRRQFDRLCRNQRGDCCRGGVGHRKAITGGAAAATSVPRHGQQVS